MIRKIHLIFCFIILLVCSVQAQVDKSLLESHFRSGNAPGQSEFHDLINSCYNYSVAKGLIYESGSNSLRAEVTLDLLKQMLSDTAKINRDRIELLIKNIEKSNDIVEADLLNRIQTNADNFNSDLEYLNLNIADSLLYHRSMFNDEISLLKLGLQDTAKHLRLFTTSKFNQLNERSERLEVDMESLDSKFRDSLLNQKMKIMSELSALYVTLQDTAMQLRQNTAGKFNQIKTETEDLKYEMESMNFDIQDSFFVHKLNLINEISSLKLVLQDTATQLRLNTNRKFSQSENRAERLTNDLDKLESKFRDSLSNQNTRLLTELSNLQHILQDTAKQLRQNSETQFNLLQTETENLKYEMEAMNLDVQDSFFVQRLHIDKEISTVNTMLRDTANHLRLNTERHFNQSEERTERLESDVEKLKLHFMDSLANHRLNLIAELSILQLELQDTTAHLRQTINSHFNQLQSGTDNLENEIESVNIELKDKLFNYNENLNKEISSLKLVLQDTAQNLRASFNSQMHLQSINNQIIHQDIETKLRALETGLKDSSELIRTSLELLELELKQDDLNAKSSFNNILSDTKSALLSIIDSLANAQNLDKTYQDNRISKIEESHNILSDTVIVMKEKLDTLNYTEYNFTQSLKLKLNNIEDGATRSDNNFADSLVSKLLDIEKNANHYQLPMSSHSKLGGIQLSGDFVLHNGKMFSALDPEKIDRWYATDTILNDWSSALETGQKWTKVRMKIPTGNVDADGKKTYDYGEFNPPYKFLYDDLESSYYEYNGTDENNVILGEHEKQKNILGKKNTLIGHKAGYNLYQGGEENVIIGFEAGESSADVSNNVFIGSQSGQNIQAGNDNAGAMNVAIGSHSMSKRNNNKESLALGYSSMELGEQIASVAIGTKAMKNNSGDNNIAIGYESALSSEGSNNKQNINIGYRSAYSSMTAQRNIGIGDSTAFNNISGQGNLFIGHGSGKTNTQSGNLFIGHGVDDGGSHKMLIGNHGNVLISGDFVTGEVNVNKLSSEEIKIGGDKVVINANAQFVGEGGVNTPTVNAERRLSAAGIEIINKSGAVITERYAIKTHTHGNSELLTDASHRFVSDSEKTSWNNKVDKVNGKSLTSNDFTLAFKNKLERVAEGANKYIHPTTHSVNMIVTDDNNRFISDVEKLKLANIEESANKYIHPNTHSANMIITDESHRFMTDVERTKLAGIQAEANHYTHPSSHQATMIVTDAAHRFTTDVEKTKLAGIQADANKYIHPSTHLATMISTDRTHRFTSDAEKSKLASIETNANNYVHPTKHAATMINTDAHHRFVSDAEKSKLSGIEASANKYIHPTTHDASMINTDSQRRFISDNEKNKLAGIQTGANKYIHPTKHSVSEITTDAHHRFISDAEKLKLSGIEADANNYHHPSSHAATIITTDAQHRFITDSEKAKLVGIQSGANKYVHPDKHAASMITTDSQRRFINDVQKTKLESVDYGANKYVHPNKHAASMITTDSQRRFISDTQKTKLEGIAHEANKYVHPNKHTADMITTTPGKRFISEAEKTKLAGIKVGANNYIHPNEHEASMITTDANRQFVSAAEKSNWSAGNIPLGGIIMWSGSSIPTGWALCDGSSKHGRRTPDLRGRFIVGNYPGRSAYNIGKKGGTVGNTVQTSKNGNHSHTGKTNTYKLTKADIPAHYHSMKHTHKISAKKGVRYSSSVDDSNPGGKGKGHRRTMDETLDSNFSTNASSSPNTGSYGNYSSSQNKHAHSIYTDGSHSHTLPYYALAFIMRVK